MRKTGFTLFEILVAALITSVFLGILGMHMFKMVEKSKVARAIADINAIKHAAIEFTNDIGFWPGSQWGDMSHAGDHFSPAAYGEGFVTTTTVKDGDTDAQKRLIYWNGPYLEKWSNTPWAMPYMWDLNYPIDANNDGITYEHVVWLDLAHSPGPYDQNPKIPKRAHERIKLVIDGNLLYKQGGMVEMMDDNPKYGTATEVIVFQGQ